VLGLLLGLALFFGGCVGRDSVTYPRGVVMIVIDTMRADAPGYAGGPQGITPTLDSWAANGVRFEQAIAEAPWTLPSTASILTGLHPPRHGAGGNMSGEFHSIQADVPTLAEILSQAGVRTHAITNGAFTAPDFGLDRGFEGYDYEAGSNSRIRRADQNIREAVAWLASLESGERFFLYLHLFDPHMNYAPPAATRGRFTGDYSGMLRAPFDQLAAVRSGELVLTDLDREFVRGLYDEEIAAVDVSLGIFSEWLQTTGLGKETAVIVTADHGEEFWDHERFEHGHSFYDELLRIPLILRLPGGALAGEVVKEQVTQVDLAPTIVNLLGVEVPAGQFDGQPLLDETLGLRPLDSPTVAVEGGLLYVARGGASALRLPAWKAVFWDSGQRTLFNLDLDPGERTDVALKQAEQLRELELLWRSLQDEAIGGQGVILDEDAKARLRSLGYLQ
jgi:arylsulfatase A-like enzyme